MPATPTNYTDREGGEWISAEGVDLSTVIYAAVMFSDGTIWDEAAARKGENGWRDGAEREPFSVQKPAKSTLGRPTAYKPEYVDQAAKLCDLGATDIEIADFFDVHVSTVYRWKLEYPDFCEAIKAAKQHADDRVERSLYQMATGFMFKEEQAIKLKVDQYKEEVEIVEVEKFKEPEATAAIFWLKNRRKDQWSDKTETTTTHNVGTGWEEIFPQVANLTRTI